MNQLLEPALTMAYIGLLLLVVRRWSFFQVGAIPSIWFQGVFVAKVLSGILLSLVYTHYYTDRATADIWKYFDDGMVMFSALREQPLDYLQMLLGIFNDTPRFDRYYSEMGHWYRPYGSQMANDTHTIIRFNAAVRLISLGFYQVHNVWANFLALVGLTGIFVFLRQMAPHKERLLFVGVFLMPWVMFWGSGVLKEPLLFFGLGMFLYGVKNWTDNGLSVRNTLLMAASILFLLTVKSYALAALLPGILALRVGGSFQKSHPAPVFLVIYLLTGGLGVLLGTLIPEQNVLQRFAQKQRDFNMLATGGTYVRQTDVPHDTLYVPANHHADLLFSENRGFVLVINDVSVRRWEQAYSDHAPVSALSAGERLEVLLDYGRTGSAINIPKLDGTVLSTLKAMPMALVNALLRPFPQDVTSPLMLIAIGENLLLLLLLILALTRMDKALLAQPLFWLCVSFAIVILILTGLVTPVVGAIVRYKVPALPFMAAALLALRR